jgi:hypothetical protein
MCRFQEKREYDFRIAFSRYERLHTRVCGVPTKHSAYLEVSCQGFPVFFFGAIVQSEHHVPLFNYHLHCHLAPDDRAYVFEDRLQPRCMKTQLLSFSVNVNVNCQKYDIWKIPSASKCLSVINSRHISADTSKILVAAARRDTSIDGHRQSPHVSSR